MSAELSQKDAAFRDWYYSIELTPGQLTQGNNFPSVALTRWILRSVPVEGLSCVDIGAMDGLISVLLARRRAKVTAYDRDDRRSNILAVKEAYGVVFDYRSGCSLAEFCDRRRSDRAEPFDVAVFSGVLYHMYDPLGGLARVRGLVRNGGIAVIETSAVISDDVAMYFNDSGRFYSGTNYFQASLKCLDSMLRFSRLKPLDCVFFNQHKDTVSHLQIVRICVPCLAVEAGLGLETDGWINKPRDLDWQEFLDWEHVSTDKLPLAYEPTNGTLVHHLELGSVDLHRTLHSTQPFPITDDLVCLHLSDME